MAVELATAYISLVADTKDLKKSIDSGVGGLSSHMEKKGSSLGSGLMKGIGGGLLIGAGAAAAAGVATLGVALTKGFSRLNSLDQATAKLEGLGHSAESVQSIMDNALAAVRGTAFGMDEAAGVAAGVVAAGVKPGAELERTLKLVADASTIAGTSMGDMGSIFNKVAGTGKIQGEVIAQLGERGIPILQLLAEEMGVSAEEVGKLASAGEIDFARFQNAMEAGMGGAALKSGETLQGSLANMQASLGRIGANFLSPVFDELAPTFTAITAAMGPLETIATGLGEKFGDFLVPILETFQGMLDGGFDFSPFMELAGYLSPVSVIFKALKPMLPQLAEAFGEIGATLGGAFSEALTTILPVMGSLVEMLSGALASVLPLLLPVLTNVALVFSQMLAAVMPLVGQLLTGLMPVLGTLLSALVPIITPLLGIVAPLLDLVTAVLPPLVDLLGIVAAVALPLVQVAAEALTPILSGIGTAIATYVTPVIETLQGTLGGLVTFLTGVFTLDWELAWQGITDTFSTIFGGIGDIVKGVINAVIDVINGIIGGINSVATAVKDGTGGMIDFTIPTIPRLAEGATIMPRRGGTLAVLAEAGRPESVVDTGLMNRALTEGLSGSNGGGSKIEQINNFQHMPPDEAIEATGQRLSSLARRGRA